MKRLYETEDNDDKNDLCNSWKLMHRKIKDELYQLRLSAWCATWNLDAAYLSGYIMHQNNIESNLTGIIVQKNLISEVVTMFRHDLSPKRWNELATSSCHKVLYVEAANSDWFWEYWIATPFCVWPDKLRSFYQLIRSLSAKRLILRLASLLTSTMVDARTQKLIRLLQEVLLKNPIINNMLSNTVLTLMLEFSMNHYVLRDFFGFEQQFPDCPFRKMSSCYDKLFQKDQWDQWEIRLRMLPTGIGQIQGVYQSANSNDKGNLYAVVSKMNLHAKLHILCCYKITSISEHLLWARYVEDCCEHPYFQRTLSFNLVEQTNVIVARGCSECRSVRFYSLLTGQEELEYVPMGLFSTNKSEKDTTSSVQLNTNECGLEDWFVHVNVRIRQYQVVSLWHSKNTWLLCREGNNNEKKVSDISSLMKTRCPFTSNSKHILKLAYYCSMDFASYLVQNCGLLHVDQNKILYFNKNYIPKEMSMLARQQESMKGMKGIICELRWSSIENIFIALIGNIAIWMVVEIGTSAYSIVWFNIKTETTECNVPCSQIDRIASGVSHMFVHPQTLDVTILGKGTNKNSNKQYDGVWCARYDWQQYFQEISHVLLPDLWQLCWSFLGAELRCQELVCLSNKIQQRIWYSNGLNVCLSC